MMIQLSLDILRCKKDEENKRKKHLQNRRETRQKCRINYLENCYTKSLNTICESRTMTVTTEPREPSTVNFLEFYLIIDFHYYRRLARVKCSSLYRSVRRIMIENESVARIEGSLSFFLRLAWSFGVPDIRIRLMWRISYTVFLGLSFFVAHYLCLDMRIGLVSSFGFKDAKVFLLTEVAIFISFNVMVVVWLTRGARAVREAILHLAKIDDVRKYSDSWFPKTEKFRFLQVLWGLQLFLTFVMTFLQFNINETSKFTDSLILTIVITFFYTSNLPGVQSALFGILFASVFHAIYYRFKYINYQLSKMGKICDEISISTNDFRIHTLQRSFKLFNGRQILMDGNCDVERLLAEIDVLDKMHKQLCEITLQFTVAFYPCLAIILTKILLQCMDYAAFCLLPVDENINVRYVVATAILGIISNVLKAWTVVSSCTDLSTEANKFGTMLHCIDVSDLRVRRKLRDYSMRHYREKLVITTFGVYRLNNSYLTYIIFTVTAYTIFIYQLNIA